MGSASQPAYCTWLSPKVTGTGLIFQSYATYTTRPKELNVSIRSATVTDSTIKISGFFPPFSNVTISQTRATMQGTTTLFDFTKMVPQNYVVFTILDTTATWPSDGTGGAVLSLVDGIRTLIKDFSAFYVIRTNATNAMSVLHLKGTDCSSLACFDIYNGLVAVDYASCTNCKTAFFFSELLDSSFANSRNGVFRFSNCTQDGNTAPFFKTSSPSLGLRFGHNGSVVFSTITTGGDLFSMPTNAYNYCSHPVQFVLLNINAKTMGTEEFSNFITTDNCDIYMGNITLNGIEYTTEAQYDTLKVNYSKIVNPFGMVLIDRGGPDSTGVNGYSNVYCVRSAYTGVTTEVLPPDEVVAEAAKKGITLDRWTRSICQCNSTSHAPYCSVVYDPILYTSGYTYTKETCTTDPVSCEDCKWGQWDQCDRCNQNYKFDAAGTNCIPMVCAVDHCKTCVFDTEDQCEICNDDYKLDENKQCTLKTCAQEPCTGCTSSFGEDDTCVSCNEPYVLETSTSQCTGCIAGYKRDGATCVEKGCSVENCQSCVFDTEDQCKVCNNNYKLEGTTCTMKTCAQAPCTECASPSGDDDTCTACGPGYEVSGTACAEKECLAENCQTCVFDSKDQCDTCDDNYKLDGTTCTKKTCAQEPCTGCTSPSGEGDVCTSCNEPFVLEASTSQCTGCIAGYKMDGSTCVEKECLVDHCKTCVFDTEDQCDVCDTNLKSDGNGGCTPMVCSVTNCAKCVDDTEDKCETCDTNLKSDGSGGCIPMVCTVANCNKCVDDTEDQCAECEGDLVAKDGVCGAKEGSGGLPLGAIIGIVIGVVVLLIILILLLLFFCCRKSKSTVEQVDHITRNEMENSDSDSKRKVEVTEETEVTVMDRAQQEGILEEENPLSAPTQNDTSQTTAPRRKARRARSVRNNGAEIADIDLDYMYDNKNEIVEED
ncbi:hypothetical protein, conserved [Angomonas deanei]|uniref:EGF-like domain-containing protein n=1 Tax=Angomonas deanei TaxID=59799 RepID=A0A7G2C8B0_9TRYP|nr:hypothetical protein, conserved [Angomonas deanei]